MKLGKEKSEGIKLPEVEFQTCLNPYIV